MILKVTEKQSFTLTSDSTFLNIFIGLIKNYIFGKIVAYGYIKSS